MRSLDLAVLLVYLIGVAVFGASFARRNRSPSAFLFAGGALPGWAVGFSLFGTFLSSNTFLGVPGSAFGSNWNAFTFSLSLPLAAWIAVRWFVPFYREIGDVSAYAHLGRRFGGWARSYGLICYLLTQLARIGAILFGVALALGTLTGWRPVWIIVLTGIVVTVYTLLGGIEAVIWTDVVQSIILSVGALTVILLVGFGMPEGWGQVFELASPAGKFSLGSFGGDLTSSTFWVVLFYGVVINLNNFGIDQSYVQRYQVANSERAATRSVWLAVWLYVPISMAFFFLGTALFSFYSSQPEQMAELARSVGASGSAVDPETIAAVADRAFPHFIVNFLPPGLAGLLIAALVAAAMSSVDTSLNSSAAVIHSDFVERFFLPDADARTTLRVLRLATVATGLAGTAIALTMIGIESLLDAWWIMSGVFVGGLLGLFLLGWVRRPAPRWSAITAVAAGVLVILWMTTSGWLPESLRFARSPFHTNLIPVFGTLTIVLVGLLLGAVASAMAQSSGVAGSSREGDPS